MTTAEEIVQPAELIELYKIGFKLVPLDEDGKPTIAWTDIYENMNYWNPERLVQESYRFKNVATTFGKTHLKDDQGPLYLYTLDIDSEEVYNSWFSNNHQRQLTDDVDIPISHVMFDGLVRL